MHEEMSENIILHNGNVGEYRCINGHFTEVSQWCDENCQRQWSVFLDHDGSRMNYFMFRSGEDAAHFVLRFA